MQLPWYHTVPHASFESTLPYPSFYTTLRHPESSICAGNDRILPWHSQTQLQELTQPLSQSPKIITDNSPLSDFSKGATTARVIVNLRKPAGDRRLVEKADISVRPHGIRHAAITEALDRTMDPRAMQRFSRHSDLGSVLRYDDNREDFAGKVPPHAGGCSKNVTTQKV